MDYKTEHITRENYLTASKRNFDMLVNSANNAEKRLKDIENNIGNVTVTELNKKIKDNQNSLEERILMCCNTNSSEIYADIIYSQYGDTIEIEASGITLDADVTIASPHTFGFAAGGVTVDIIRDDDTMADDDPNALVTQQSIKAYVDTAVSGALSFGTDNQIPYTNAAGDDFDYSANLTFDGTDFTLGGGESVDIIRDEDNMASDDENALATQQSIKAYVDGLSAMGSVGEIPYSATGSGTDIGANGVVYA